MTKSPKAELWRDARLARLLRSELPIIQAPMAGATSVGMVAGAIEGGALGSIPCALIPPDQARADVETVRAMAGGPLNLNFFCHDLGDPPDESAWRALLAPMLGAGPAKTPPLRQPFDDAMCALVEAVQPEVVSFHFGLPAPRLLDRVKAAGAVVLSSATTVAEARWLAERGCDAIIAQGWEAGGHRGWFLTGEMTGQAGTLALVPQIVDAVDLPVIAAGGIGDGRGIAAALMLGASAVQLGTAYLKTVESPVPAAHRALLGGECADETVLTNVLTGGFARGYATAFVEKVGPVSDTAPRFPYAGSAVGELRSAAGEDGYRFAPMWAGQAAALTPDHLTAEALTRRLAQQALDLLGGGRLAAAGVQA